MGGPSQVFLDPQDEEGNPEGIPLLRARAWAGEPLLGTNGLGNPLDNLLPPVDKGGGEVEWCLPD